MKRKLNNVVVFNISVVLESGVANFTWCSKKYHYESLISLLSSQLTTIEKNTPLDYHIGGHLYPDQHFCIDELNI